MSSLKERTAKARIKSLLADGLPHTREELKGCLKYDQASFSAVAVQLVAIRKELIPIRQRISIEYIGSKLHYRLVALLPHVEDIFK